ncbi:SapB/AmfS family lanthipeptide [Klebsiella pneumoniae]
MADVLDLQDDDEPETPADQKQSGVSYSLCRNSRTSQLFCIRP